MIKDAQKQVGQYSQTIADETLLLFAITGMLTTECYPQANNDWEDRAKNPKIWADWKAIYKNAHAKARVKAQAAKGDDKFGAANAAERVLKNSEVTTGDGGYKVGMKDLEGSF